jgi:hypothetical protein
MENVRRTIRDNLVAITSLVVALSALGYNTWRNERTERNRNVRVAGIEMLKEIGSLQEIVSQVSSGDEVPAGNPPRDPRGQLRMGWVDVWTLNDLASVMPADVTREARELEAAWEADVEELPASDASSQRINAAIEELRQATLTSLRALR